MARRKKQKASLSERLVEVVIGLVGLFVMYLVAKIALANYIGGISSTLGG